MSGTYFTDPRHHTSKALVFKNWVMASGRKWDECYQGIYDCILRGWVDCDDTGRLWLTDLGIAKQARKEGVTSAEIEASLAINKMRH
jgi:hypothetical protein